MQVKIRITKRDPVALALGLRRSSSAAGAHRKGVKTTRQAAQKFIRSEVRHADR
jgi:hypothetical protein